MVHPVYLPLTQDAAHCSVITAMSFSIHLQLQLHINTNRDWPADADGNCVTTGSP